MLSVVLIPLSIYPYILSQLAENNLWHWSFAVQVTPFLGMLYWALFGHWPVPDKPQKNPFQFPPGDITQRFYLWRDLSFVARRTL